MFRLLSLCHIGWFGWAATGVIALGIFTGQSDVGQEVRAGSVDFDAGTNLYRLTGGGNGIGGSADSFHFLYTQTGGDVTLRTDVAFVGPANRRGAAALMIRQSLNPASAFAALSVNTNGVAELQYRPGQDVAASAFRVAWKNPLHLLLIRRGNEFSVRAGNRAEQCAESGPVIVSMSGPVYVGLAVSAQDAAGLETADFRNVSLGDGRKQSHAPAFLQLVPEHGRVGLPLW